MKTSLLLKKLASAGFVDNNAEKPVKAGEWRTWTTGVSRIQFLNYEEVDMMIVDCQLALLGKLKMNCQIDNTRGLCGTWPQVEKVLKKHEQIANNYAMEQLVKESPMVKQVEQNTQTTAAFVAAWAK